jgi:hypothetical protein
MPAEDNTCAKRLRAGLRDYGRGIGNDGLRRGNEQQQQESFLGLAIGDYRHHRNYVVDVGNGARSLFSQPDRYGR